SNLHKIIPGFIIPKSRLKLSKVYEHKDFWQSVGYRLRKSFEELGPSFIKVGQLLSTREDLFDPAMIAELKKLQDSVQPVDFSQAREVISRTLSKPIEEIFESIHPDPIGVASIGMVYRGKLKTGEDVVIKVRRPGIKKTITSDFEIIAFVV